MKPMLTILLGLSWLCLLASAYRIGSRLQLRRPTTVSPLKLINIPEVDGKSNSFVCRTFAVGTSGSQDASTSFSKPLADINKLYYRASWLSWWVQIILSVVSSVILTFANAVRPVGTKASYLWISGFSFSSLGVLMALGNSFWTWNITRLCRRISRRKVEESKVVLLLRRYSQISVAISIFGMLLSILGAEQIVGTLASKVLSNGGYSPFIGTGINNLNGIGGIGVTPIQAVDIFLVQANTNALLAHFASLVCYLLLQTRLPVAVAKPVTPAVAPSK